MVWLFRCYYFFCFCWSVVRPLQDLNFDIDVKLSLALIKKCSRTKTVNKKQAHWIGTGPLLWIFPLRFYFLHNSAASFFSLTRALPRSGSIWGPTRRMVNMVLGSMAALRASESWHLYCMRKILFSSKLSSLVCGKNVLLGHI